MQFTSIAAFSGVEFTGVLMYGATGAHRTRSIQVRTELQRVGVPNVFEFWSTSSPYDRLMLRALRGRTPAYGSYVTVTLRHEQMLRAALDFGATHAMFFENDIRFLKDKERIAEIMAGLPKEYDLALLDWYISNECKPGTASRVLEAAKSTHWIPVIDDFVSGAAYSLSRRGMEWLVRALDDPARGRGLLSIIDRHWKKMADAGLACFCASPCVCTQCCGGGTSTVSRLWRRYRSVGLSREDYAE